MIGSNVYNYIVVTTTSAASGTTGGVNYGGNFGGILGSGINQTEGDR